MSCELFAKTKFQARTLIANTTAEYKRLSRTITDARRAGLSIGIILKTGRATLEAYPSWKSAADILRRAAESYQRDLWANQRRRPEIWIEKAALIGVIKPACRRWRVPHMAARGYPSHSELYMRPASALTALRAGVRSRSSSISATMTPAASIWTGACGQSFRSMRGARSRSISGLGLPPNPAKETDTRLEQYVADRRDRQLGARRAEPGQHRRAA
jgi:hypothetical protein